MKNIIQVTIFFAVLMASLVAQAHNLWLLPSETSKGGKGGWVTFDVAVSTEIFNVGSGAPKVDVVEVVAPDAAVSKVQNIWQGKLRSSFDLDINQPGTYKIFAATHGLIARWETADGKRGFWPPRGAKAEPSELAAAVPKNAKNLEIIQASRRTETFVSLGAPSKVSLKPTLQGLELVPLTHPNNLAVGEVSEFMFLMDGKPAVGAKIAVIEGGSRYRLAPGAQHYETDKNGQVKISWKKTGIYWLGAEYKDDQATKPATHRSGVYSATLEVLSE